MLAICVTALSPCCLDNVWRRTAYSLWAHLVEFSVTSCAVRLLIFIYSPQKPVLQLLVKGKVIPQSLDRSGGFQEAEASWFQDNRHLKLVRLSALRDIVEDSSILWYFFLSNGKCLATFRRNVMPQSSVSLCLVLQKGAPCYSKTNITRHGVTFQKTWDLTWRHICHAYCPQMNRALHQRISLSFTCSRLCFLCMFSSYCIVWYL